MRYAWHQDRWADSKELRLQRPSVKLPQGSKLSQGALILQCLPGVGRHAIGRRAEVPNQGDAHSNDAADTGPETSVEGVIVDLPWFWGREHASFQSAAPALLSAHYF